MKRTNLSPPAARKSTPSARPLAAAPQRTAWEPDDDQDMPQHLLPAPWTYGSVDDDEEEE